MLPPALVQKGTVCPLVVLAKQISIGSSTGVLSGSASAAVMPHAALYAVGGVVQLIEPSTGHASGAVSAGSQLALGWAGGGVQLQHGLQAAGSMGHDSAATSRAEGVADAPEGSAAATGQQQRHDPAASVGAGSGGMADDTATDPPTAAASTTSQPESPGQLGSPQMPASGWCRCLPLAGEC